MSELQHLIDSLQDTDEAFARLEGDGTERPDDEILRINSQAILRRREVLERRLDEHLHASQSELVRYRIKRDWDDHYPAKAVAVAMSAFQDLVTSVFDALHTAPKQRFHPSMESVELSTFEFAGASAGSVVISLAALNERMLFGDTDLDRTFNLVEQALSARTSDDLNRLAQIIGVASITKAYSWAEATAQYGLDTTITWGKSIADTREVSITRDDATSIRDIIRQKSETKTHPVEMTGVLLGFDGATLYFHFEPFGEKLDIKGKVDPALSKSWTTGHTYVAKLLRVEELVYATGQENLDWTLVALEPVEPKELPLIE